MPKQWPQVVLGEILTERNETPNPALVRAGDIPIISKIRFSDGGIELRTDSDTNTKMILIHPGDLVLSGINSMKGAIAIYQPETSLKAAATIHYTAYQVKKERADIRYLWWLLRSLYFQEILSQQVPQGIKTELKAKRLLPVVIPLPSLDDQQRIVKRLSNISEKVSLLRSLHITTREECTISIDSFLQSLVLKLEKDYEVLPLEKLILQSGYGTSKKCLEERKENSTPVLRIPNIALEKMNLDNLKYAVFTDIEKRKLSLEKGDIVIVRTNGSPTLIGRCAVIPDISETVGFASYLIRIKVDKKLVIPEYVQLILRHQRNIGKLFDIAKTTAGQLNVSLGRIKKTLIPIPSIIVQHETICVFEKFQTYFSDIALLQNFSSVEIDQLLASVVNHFLKENEY
jgi:type I restriction enzyme, S subunit